MLLGSGPLVLDLSLPGFEPEGAGGPADPARPATPGASAASAAPASSGSASTRRDPPDPAAVRNRSLAIGVGAVVVTPVLGWLTWWSIEEKVPFNFANEGWFDPDTYAGGADKANHLVAGYICLLYTSDAADE